MKANYKPLQQMADRLQYRLQDCIDDDSAASGRQITQMARNVREEIEADKPPRSIEARIVQLQRRLEDLKAHGSGVMSPQDAHNFLEDYEDLRRDVRRLPNY